MSEIVFETKTFNKAMQEFAQETGMDTRDVLRDQMRLFTKSVISMTPPGKAAQGKRAIDVSINNIFGRLDDAEAKEQLDLAFGRRLWPLTFDMDSDQFWVHHEQYRNKKTGRTPVFNKPVNAGGLRFDGKPYVLARDLKRYALARKKKVGRLKAGWNRAAQVFGFLPSKWIAKHGRAEGAAVDAFNVHTLAGYLEATNRVPYSGRHKHIPQVAMKGRVRALTTRLDRELERLAKKKSAS